MKFLVDTGANKNYISPKHVNIENAKPENGIVKNINGTHNITKSASFDVFGIKKKIKFFIFKFHEYFDGLIGYETLRDLKAKLDIGKNQLKIGRKIVNLKKKFPSEHTLTLNEQEFQFIEINTKNDGDFVLSKEKCFNNFSILPGAYRSLNNKAFVAIRNYKKSNLEINITELDPNNAKFTVQRESIEYDKKDFEITDDSLSEYERRALQKILNQNSEIIYADEQKLTFTHNIKHKIRTVDDIPIHTKSYRYPQIYEEEVQQQVQKLLRDGIVSESVSPYTSPIWIVPKKADASGTKRFRLVIDYRKLNEKTISDRYPIPDITEILDKLGKATYFSTVDLVSGFHQIQLDEGDREKTAFSINGGKYEFTRMPFGLKNAPATFQRVMDAVLREFIGKCCLVYMDDIIVFSSSFEEHVKDIQNVFAKLKQANLKIQLEKCFFFRKETQFLGHTVTRNGVRPNADKIEVIRSWPVPKNEKELKQFLGTIGYYRRFIKDFAKLVKPLTQLLRKDIEFVFSKGEIACFEKCRQILTMDPILQYPDFQKEFILTTDASDYAIGAVLAQGTIGRDRPIAFASRTLNKTEENYSTTEKEFLAMYWAVKHFRPYLYGRKFKLVTDHQPLTYSLTNTNRRILRGKLDLEEFDYELIYKPGKSNTVADALSRIRPDELNANEGHEDQLASAESDLETVHSADTSDDFFIWCTEKPINIFKNQIIFKVANFESILHEQVFPKYHRYTVVKTNYTEENVTEIFRDYLNPKGINCIKVPIPLIQLIQETYRKHFAVNNIFKVYISETLLEDIRQQNEQDEIIKETHSFAHRGIKENKIQILQRYFFPELDRKLKIYIGSCGICKKSKYDRKPPQLIRKSVFGESPFERVHVDVFFMKGLKWMTIVDSFSKFANTIPLESRTIVDMKRGISEHIRQFGRPKVIVCDQEPSFKSIDFIGFLNDLGIEIHHASGSNSNGIVERFHSTLIELYRTLKHKNPHASTIDQINIITDIYNNTFHSVTKRKPREIVFNHKSTVDVEDIVANANKLHSAIKIELNKRKETYEKKHEDKQQPPKLNPNDNKYIKVSQRLNKDQDPFKITTVETDNDLTFIDKNNIKIHKNRIKN